MIISAIEKLSNVTLVNDDESTNVHNPKSNLIAYVTKQHPNFQMWQTDTSPTFISEQASIEI